MGDAFDRACCLLGDVAMLTHVREIMANRIIEEASQTSKVHGPPKRNCKELICFSP